MAASLKKAGMFIYRAAALLTAAGLLLFSASCGEKGAEPYGGQDYVMGTLMTQTIYGGNEELAKKATSEIRVMEAAISNKFNTSEVSKISALAGSGGVESKYFDIYKLAVDVSVKSGGAFDITIAPVVDLWGIGTPDARVPSREEIEGLLPFVDYGFVKLEDGTVSLTKEGAALDLGSIGKGAAADLALSVYRDAGISSAIVAVGGSIGVLGGKPGGAPFIIGVRDPKGGGNDYLGTLALKDISVSTSGSYERFVEKEGVRYHHILDPKTGYPADSGLVSVTVVHENGALCDALSTACFVLGLEKGVKLLDGYGANGIFIDKEDKVFVTKGIQSNFELKDGLGYELVKIE